MLVQGQLDKGNQTTYWSAEELVSDVFEKVWYWSGRKTVDLFTKLMLNLDIVRHAPLPNGPKILAANHPTTTDPALVMKLASEQTSILISETLFKVPVFGRYLRRAGHVRVIRSNGRASLEEAVQLLKEGRTVIIFPEGAISPTEGNFHQAHTGIARMALRTGAPVVPVGIGLDRERIRLVETEVDGKTEVGAWYLSGPYAMTVGEPMYFEGDVEDRKYVREVSTRIMERIIQLARQSTARVKASQAYADHTIARPIPATSTS